MPSKTRLCKFQKKGQCTRGATCVYAHGREEQHEARAANCLPKTCKFYPKGLCKFGEACAKRHLDPTEDIAELLAIANAAETADAAVNAVLGMELLIPDFASDAEAEVAEQLDQAGLFNIDIAQLVNDVSDSRLTMRMSSWADMKDDSDVEPDAPQTSLPQTPVDSGNAASSTAQSAKARQREAWADMYDESGESDELEGDEPGDDGNTDESSSDQLGPDLDGPISS